MAAFGVAKMSILAIFGLTYVYTDTLAASTVLIVRWKNMKCSSAFKEKKERKGLCFAELETLTAPHNALDT